MKKIKIFSILVISLLLFTGCNSQKTNLTENQEVTYKNLKFSIPANFEKTEEEGWVSYNWASDDFKNSCNLSLSTYKTIKTVDLEGIAYDDLTAFADDENNIKTSTITVNGIIWAKAEVYNNQKSSFTAYATEKNGEVYTIRYDDYGSGEICAEVLSIIEKSLSY